ncbi:DNA mismatch repair protein msh6, variant 2, partial [Bonamia ostreae]
IFENEEGGKQNTLFEWLNRCSTPFGHRLLKEWVARPLCNIQNINKRLDAIENLMELPELAEQISKKLNLLTDIEKMIIRIRAYSLQKRKIVFYENIDLKYLRIFVQIINSLKICCEIIYLFKRIKNKIFSKKLIELVFDLFPKECEEKLRISEKIDIEESEEKQKIVPKGQISEKFENIKEEMNLIKSKLEQHLNKYKKIFNDPSICFFEGFISNYQIEMKSETANQKLSEDLIEVSRTSKKRRFTTNEIKSLVEELEILQEKKNEYLESYLKTVLAEFCDHSKMWSAAIKSIAELDCILALYNVSAFSTGSMVRPFIVKNQEKPFLELKQSWHPQISFSEQTTSTTGFVPNDIFIGDGADTKAMIIVTGPNMGGKSTLLRQTCIAVILAQLGCFVPAKSAKLSLTDRIFTRIGANDAILANKSTFFVELEETSNILNNATENSLVILDELGRGTSTFDGAAIAFAVCEHLSKIVNFQILKMKNF